MKIDLNWRLNIMKIRTGVVGGIAILFILNGCAIFYAPSLPNIPLFSEEDNTNLNASLSAFGAEFQGAQKIFDDFAVIVNYQRIDQNNDNGGKMDSKTFEAGLGWLLTGNEHLRFEIFAGGGVGAFDLKNPQFVIGEFGEIITAKGNLQKFFVQANLGTSFMFFESAISARFVNNNFTNLRYTNLAYKPTTNLSFFEIGILLRLGPPKVKLQSFFGISTSLGDKKTALEYFPIIFGVGINVRF